MHNKFALFDEQKFVWWTNRNGSTFYYYCFTLTWIIFWWAQQQKKKCIGHKCVSRIKFRHDFHLLNMFIYFQFIWLILEKKPFNLSTLYWIWKIAIELFTFTLQRMCRSCAVWLNFVEWVICLFVFPFLSSIGSFSDHFAKYWICSFLLWIDSIMRMISSSVLISRWPILRW